jgi:vacuolar-type H+-ATPase subunit E/Vma4
MTTVEGNIDTLSRAIMGEAQAEIEDLKSNSQSKAEGILQRARAVAEQQKVEIIERARQEARRLQDQGTATAQLNARTLELEHREQLLQKVFDAAAARLYEAPGRKDYAETVLVLLREALAQLRTNAAVVRADRATQALLTKSALERISGETGIDVRMGEALENGTGVLVQSLDGRLQFDNTLENRLDRLRSTLRADVYRLLTGETK